MALVTEILSNCLFVISSVIELWYYTNTKIILQKEVLCVLCTKNNNGLSLDRHNRPTYMKHLVQGCWVIPDTYKPL